MNEKDEGQEQEVITEEQAEKDKRLDSAEHRVERLRRELHLYGIRVPE